jgi:NAD(P)-dependent dehydrogenase (short-subunit alcohol dehydrogenase family)
MTHSFDGDVFVVTGGAGGIGQATGAALAERGGRVVLTDIDERAGNQAADEVRELTGGEVRFEPLDVTDPSAVAQCAQKLDDEGWPVFGLMANAGVAPSSSAVDYSDELWLRTVNINLNGVFWCCREFGKRMIARGRGSVVTTSSIAGFRVVSPERHAAYGATKAAVAHLAELLGVEWAKTGVRVNAIAPGYTRTPILESLQSESPDTFNEWIGRTPVGRLNEPTEIADAVAFLMSKASRGITGTVVHIDGGYSAR